MVVEERFRSVVRFYKTKYKGTKMLNVISLNRTKMLDLSQTANWKGFEVGKINLIMTTSIFFLTNTLINYTVQKIPYTIRLIQNLSTIIFSTVVRKKKIAFKKLYLNTSDLSRLYYIKVWSCRPVAMNFRI